MKVMLPTLMLCMLFSGCGTITFPSLVPKDPSQIRKEIIQRSGCKANFDESGKFVGQSCDKDYRFSINKSEERLGFLSKLFGTLGNTIIFLIVGFIAFFIAAPGTAIAFLVKKKGEIEQQLELHKKALAQTVKGIEKSGVVLKDEKVANELRSSQDTDTKDLIDTLRNKL